MEDDDINRGFLNGRTGDTAYRKKVNKKLNRDKNVKFRSFITEFDMEEQLRRIEISEPEMKKRMRSYWKARIQRLEIKFAAAETDAEKEKYRGKLRALKLIKHQEKKEVKEHLNQNFARDFRAWLIGKGLSRDHNKTKWGRQSLARLPGVSEYINSFAQVKFDLFKKLTYLNEFGPHDLNEAYLYYKYLVVGDIEDFYRTDFFAELDNLGQDLYKIRNDNVSQKPQDFVSAKSAELMDKNYTEVGRENDRVRSRRNLNDGQNVQGRIHDELSRDLNIPGKSDGKAKLGGEVDPDLPHSPEVKQELNFNPEEKIGFDMDAGSEDMIIHDEPLPDYGLDEGDIVVHEQPDPEKEEELKIKRREEIAKNAQIQLEQAEKEEKAKEVPREKAKKRQREEGQTEELEQEVERPSAERGLMGEEEEENFLKLMQKDIIIANKDRSIKELKEENEYLEETVEGMTMEKGAIMERVNQFGAVFVNIVNQYEAERQWAEGVLNQMQQYYTQNVQNLESSAQQLKIKFEEVKKDADYKLALLQQQEQQLIQYQDQIPKEEYENKIAELEKFKDQLVQFSTFMVVEAVKAGLFESVNDMRNSFKEYLRKVKEANKGQPPEVIRQKLKDTKKNYAPAIGLIQQAMIQNVPQETAVAIVDNSLLPILEEEVETVPFNPVPNQELVKNIKERKDIKTSSKSKVSTTVDVAKTTGKEKNEKALAKKRGLELTKSNK